MVNSGVLGGGVVVPNITFFDHNYDIDENAQGICFQHILQNQADAIFLLSSTGEGAFIHNTPAVENHMLDFTVHFLPESTYLVVGCFGENADEIIADLQEKEQYKRINAFVITPPRTFKLNGDKLGAIFLKVAEQSSKPIYLYNNPENFGANEIPLEYLDQFARNDNILGIKDSGSSFEYKLECAKYLSDKFWVFTGKEGEYGTLLLAVPPSLRKYVGVVPSLGNLSNIFYKIEEKCDNDDFLEVLQEEVNSWRNNFYDLSTPKGKAQRGMKIALELLYPGQIASQPIVSPELEVEVPPEFRVAVADWLPIITDRGFISKIEGL